MSDTSLQEVSFAPDDDLEMTKRKLRIMQDEVLRLSQAMSGMLALSSQDQSIDLQNPATSSTAGAVLSYVNVTVNGVAARLAVLAP